MKKILSLGVAAAVLSLTAVAASAAIAPVVLNDAVEGETITVEVVANGMTLPGAQFTVQASEGLTLAEATPTTNGFADFANNTFAWASTAPAADGDVLLTLVYTVDAAADEEISVSLVPAAGFEADVDAAAAVAVVIAGDTGAEDLETIETIETIETTEEGEGGEIIETVETVETVETIETTDAGNEETTNPETGIALAVAPAMLAGAAIVVAKKRK